MKQLDVGRLNGAVVLGLTWPFVAACAQGCGSSNANGVEAPGDDSGQGVLDGSSNSEGDSGTVHPNDAGGTIPNDAGALLPEAGPPVTGYSFDIDMRGGPARQFQPPTAPTAVSPYVYGINGFGSFLARKTKWGLIREGGDAYTAWNWTNNYGNSGADYCFWQGNENGSGVIGELLTGDSLTAAKAEGAAYVVTTPILEHVSAAVSNNTGINNLCPQTASNCGGGTTSSVDVNSGNLDFVSTDPNSAAFVANGAKKPTAFCTCPGPACGTGCTVAATGPVYQDELANYLKVNYGTGSPIFFDLDNEPNYWESAHPELWPTTGALPCQQGSVTYDDIVSRDKTFAAALKAAWPAAKVFGPVVAQDGLVYAHSYGADPHSPTEFLDYYLQQMAAAGSLLDVLDVHYYNSSSTDAAQCVQSPRMFWDPGYTSLSASATDAIDFGYSGVGNYFDTNWYPRKLIPRLQAKIAAAYPTGAPGLSFGEYNSGCETTIAGGVAEADNLGIFGREGVFAASAWPLQSLTTNYLVAAYDAYRNYDGNGAVVGDLAVNAIAEDPTGTSVYAFATTGNTAAVDLVAVNKTTASYPATIGIANAPFLTRATLYNLVNGSPAVVPAAGTAPTLACSGTTCTTSVTLPAMSVTTLILR